MQINTPEAMQKAFKLLQKYGSWEEVERATDATRHTLEVILGAPIDGPLSPGKPKGE